MAAPRFAWVLNLDADLELAAPQGYTPKNSVRDAMGSFVSVLARSLLAPGDVLVDESSAPHVARGLTGRAFCPTPRAIAILRRAGAVPEPAPPVDVLRRVNSRAFASSLGATLAGGAFVTSLDEARVKLGGRPRLGDAWRVKRAFGMAGRGHRVVDAGAATDADLAFVRAGMREGGVQIEPNVSIAKEYAVHGIIAEDGSWRLGSTVEQRCDPSGAWLATVPLLVSRAAAAGTPDTPADEASEVSARLAEEAQEVAVALARAHYFGPFGVDAYSYRGPLLVRAQTRGPRDALHLQPRSEINARYSMGFAVGFPRPRE